MIWIQEAKSKTELGQAVNSLPKFSLDVTDIKFAKYVKYVDPGDTVLWMDDILRLFFWESAVLLANVLSYLNLLWLFE